MSLTRSVDFQSFRTRDLSWLDSSGNPPAANSLLTVGVIPYMPDRTSWTVDLSLNTLTLGPGGGILTYDSSSAVLLVNNLPINGAIGPAGPVGSTGILGNVGSAGMNGTTGTIGSSIPGKPGKGATMVVLDISQSLTINATLYPQFYAMPYVLKLTLIGGGGGGGGGNGYPGAAIGNPCAGGGGCGYTTFYTLDLSGEVFLNAIIGKGGAGGLFGTLVFTPFPFFRPPADGVAGGDTLVDISWNSSSIQIKARGGTQSFGGNYVGSPLAGEDGEFRTGNNVNGGNGGGICGGVGSLGGAKNGGRGVFRNTGSGGGGGGGGNNREGESGGDGDDGVVILEFMPKL